MSYFPEESYEEDLEPLEQEETEFDKEYADPRRLCPRGGCIFCCGPRDDSGSYTVGDMIREMEEERKNPALAELRRNRQVWDYPQLPVNYREYLQGEFWKHIRKRVIRMAEANFEGCFGCSIPLQKCWKVYGHGFHVHHVTYARLGNEHPDDLVALCPSCHAKEHGLPEPTRRA